MQFVVEQARSAVDLQSVQEVETRVFRIEKGIDLPPLTTDPANTVHRLIAKHVPSGEPVGTVSVIETNMDCPIFGRYAELISGNRRGRVARYTRLAVLPEYRGHSLWMRMMLEAQRRFVAPEKIENTWLLFDAAKAPTSLIATLLGYRCGAPVIRSEYGRCRLLFRDELSTTALTGNRCGWAYLNALAAAESLAQPVFPIPRSLTIPSGSMSLPHAA